MLPASSGDQSNRELHMNTKELALNMALFVCLFLPDKGVMADLIRQVAPMHSLTR